MLKSYCVTVCKLLQRQLSEPEWDIVQRFFYLGYSVNYTAEYLR